MLGCLTKTMSLTVVVAMGRVDGTENLQVPSNVSTEYTGEYGW